MTTKLETENISTCNLGKKCEGLKIFCHGCCEVCAEKETFDKLKSVFDNIYDDESEE